MCAGLIQFVATLALGLPAWTDSLALKDGRIYVFAEHTCSKLFSVSDIM
jgi:hypothetical protein